MFTYKANHIYSVINVAFCFRNDLSFCAGRERATGTNADEGETEKSANSNRQILSIGSRDTIFNWLWRWTKSFDKNFWQIFIKNFNTKFSEIIIFLGYVALQMSDRLLSDSVKVVRHLRKENENCQFFVVADSTYGEGDIDEVSARHLDCGKIIFFGDSNMKTITSLDTLCIRYFSTVYFNLRFRKEPKIKMTICPPTHSSRNTLF